MLLFILDLNNLAPESQSKEKTETMSILAASILTVGLALMLFSFIDVLKSSRFNDTSMRFVGFLLISAGTYGLYIWGPL